MNEFGPSSIDKAKYRLVHDYPGGARTLAPLINMKSASVLSNKVNPDMDSHHLSVDESVALQAITGNYALLRAMATALNHALIPLPKPDQKASDIELLDCWASWQEVCGETAAAIRRGLEDGQLDKQEFEEIKTEIHEDITKELQLLQRLEQLVV